MQREITRELVRRLLPERMTESNKGSYGSVLAAAGSMAYRGAAALCTEGALRGGAGLVYLASVEPVIQLVLSRTPECCACGCRTAANGGIHPQDADALRRWFADRHAVLLAGPGLGESAADVCKALLGRNAPWAGVVLDADALNALAAGKYRGDLPANTILTPHPGEAARLLGLTAPTKGSFTIDGKQFPADRIAILKEVGSFIESPSFYANLTGRENLDIIRRILGLPKSAVEDALDLVGLTEFGDRLAKKYSLGMKQRLGLAGALLGRPPILILDEPTNGLDPSGIHEIRNLVKSLPDLYDCTILISSHMLSEIELIADDIGILNHGRLLFEGSLDELRQSALRAGFAADNLEDMFLSMVEKDNAARKQRAQL